MSNIRPFINRRNNTINIRPYEDLERSHGEHISRIESDCDMNAFHHIYSHNTFYNDYSPERLPYEDISIFTITDNYAFKKRLITNNFFLQYCSVLNINIPNDTLDRCVDLREFMEVNKQSHTPLQLRDGNHHGVLTDFIVNRVENPREYFLRVHPLLYFDSLHIKLTHLNVTHEHIQPDILQPIDQMQQDDNIDEHIIPDEHIDIELSSVSNSHVSDASDLEDEDDLIEIVIHRNHQIIDNGNHLLVPPRGRNLCIVTLLWLSNLLSYLLFHVIYIHSPFLWLHHQFINIYSMIREDYRKFIHSHGGDINVDTDEETGDLRPIVFGDRTTSWSKYILSLLPSVFWYIYHVIKRYFFPIRDHRLDDNGGLSAESFYYVGTHVSNPIQVNQHYYNTYNTLGYTHYRLGRIHVGCYNHIVSTRISQLESSNVALTIAANVNQYFQTNNIPADDSLIVNTSMYSLQRIRLMQHYINDIPLMNNNRIGTVAF